MIVKTDVYKKDEIARIINLRADIEGLKLGDSVLAKLADEGDRSSLRYDDNSVPINDCK